MSRSSKILRGALGGGKGTKRALALQDAPCRMLPSKGKGETHQRQGCWLQKGNSEFEEIIHATVGTLIIIDLMGRVSAGWFVVVCIKDKWRRDRLRHAHCRSPHHHVTRPRHTTSHHTTASHCHSPAQNQPTHPHTTLGRHNSVSTMVCLVRAPALVRVCFVKFLLFRCHLTSQWRSPIKSTIQPC